MSEEHAVPEFTLPAWGTDGAPPEPTVDEDAPTAETHDTEIEIRVEPSVSLTSGPLPPRWAVETLHGLVVAHGHSDDGDLADSVEAATGRALERLEEAAADLGANAVTDIRLSTTARKAFVAVTAYGTAVTFTR